MPSTPRPHNIGGPPLVQPKILQPRQTTPTYFYIYDGALSEPKYANTLARIETHLTDLELQGRVGRLGPLKSAKEMVASAIKSGASTVVAVGDDATIAQTINAIAETPATLGVIPAGATSSRFAQLLGLPMGEAACEVLAARKIEMVDLGKANHYYFLTCLDVRGDAVTIAGDDSWTLETPTASTIHIANLDSSAKGQDGILELSIELVKKNGWFRQQRDRSLIPFHEATISSAADGASVLVEQVFTLTMPVTVSVLPTALKVIVGKNRKF